MSEKMDLEKMRIQASLNFHFSSKEHLESFIDKMELAVMEGKQKKECKTYELKAFEILLDVYKSILKKFEETEKQFSNGIADGKNKPIMVENWLYTNDEVEKILMLDTRGG